MAKETKVAYQNNPFYIALEGLTTLFKKAQSVAILAIVLSAIGFLGNGISSFYNPSFEDDNPPVSQVQQQKATDEMSQVPTAVWVVIGIVIATVLFLLILFGVVVSGVVDYTSARLAGGHETDLGEALKAVFTHIGSYLWLQIVIIVKIFLWSLLFIIPGLIMSVRYTLAGTAFFDKDLRGNKAVKHSLKLTKGAWLTTFAASSLWNIITFGLIELLLKPGTNAVLYRQYSDTSEKPAAHWLSWFTLIVPIVLGLLFVLLIVSLMFALANFNFS